MYLRFLTLLVLIGAILNAQQSSAPQTAPNVSAWGASPASTQSPVVPVSNQPVDAGVRLKDLVTIEGVRTNQLVGYGLVVGLNGTGDRQQTLFSAQSLTNLLQRMGVSVSPTLITVKNTAAVIVTATLPPFAQPGTNVDATVGAIGDATNLQGGLLVLTTLRGVNGQVYATVQGPVITGGFIAGRSSANSQTVNHPTVARIPNGVAIERSRPSVPLGTREASAQRVRFHDLCQDVGSHQPPFQFNGVHADNSSLVTVNLPPELQQPANRIYCGTRTSHRRARSRREGRDQRAYRHRHFR